MVYKFTTIGSTAEIVNFNAFSVRYDNCLLRKVPFQWFSKILRFMRLTGVWL